VNQSVLVKVFEERIPPGIFQFQEEAEWHHHRSLIHMPEIDALIARPCASLRHSFLWYECAGSRAVP
jgi:hypothetical protein